MTDPNTKPETAPAHINPPVAPEAIAKVAPQTGEHKDAPVVESPKS